MSITRKVAFTGMGIALYVVLSMVAKIPVIAHISLDLGYIAFAVILYHIGVIPGTIVGAAGCVLVSLLTTGWFPPGWLVGNIVIGLMCGLLIQRDGTWQATIINVFVCVVAVGIGILGLKTLIECHLYGIPLMVKLPKNAVAFAMDAVVMSAGMVFAQRGPIVKVYARLRKGD